MKLAAMQPYLFPYIGYYQLAYSVDTFVFLDDVNHIKGGYINRNHTLSQTGEKMRFTLSILNQSQNRLINQHEYGSDEEKVLKTLHRCHARARHFARFMPIIEDTLKSPDRNVARLSARSITSVFAALNILRTFSFSSEIGNPEKLSGGNRIIDLCRRLGATEYINAIGGTKLYDKAYFQAHGVSLNFIRVEKDFIRCNDQDFSQISIIDVLMNCPEDVIVAMLHAYELV